MSSWQHRNPSFAAGTKEHKMMQAGMDTPENPSQTRMVGMAFNDARELCNRIAALHDALLGQRPPQQDKAGPSAGLPIAGGALNGMASGAVEIRNMVAAAMGDLSKIERSFDL